MKANHHGAERQWKRTQRLLSTYHQRSVEGWLSEDRSDVACLVSVCSCALTLAILECRKDWVWVTFHRVAMQQGLGSAPEQHRKELSTFQHPRTAPLLKDWIRISDFQSKTGSPMVIMQPAPDGGRELQRPKIP